MAFITYPLNNIDYTAEDAELFHCTRTSGVWAEDSFPISVTGADNNVTIGRGIAWINNEEFSGKVAALKSAENIDLGIADGIYPRIDVIAIQYSANNNATDVVIKKGTPATNPVRPAIVRSGAVYELYLASVYRPAGTTAITASNITDLRMDETVCGLMADSVTKVDMTAIEAQVRAIINNLETEIDAIKDLSGLMFISEWTEDGVIPITKGGTGSNNIADVRSRINFIGRNIINNIGLDTPSFWIEQGTGVIHIYNNPNLIIDQPAANGLILNIVNPSGSLRQLWFVLTTGDIYHRGGNNTTGWSGTWIKIIDKNNIMFDVGSIAGTNIAAGAYRDVNITFNKTFADAPIVNFNLYSTSVDGGVGKCTAAYVPNSGSKTGCTVRIFNGDTVIRAPGLEWRAMNKDLFI